MTSKGQRSREEAINDQQAPIPAACRRRGGLGQRALRTCLGDQLPRAPRRRAVWPMSASASSSMRRMRSRSGSCTNEHRPLTDWIAPDSLQVSGHAAIGAVRGPRARSEAADTAHGPARRLRLRGAAGTQLEKTLEIELFQRYPGFAVYACQLSQHSPAPRSRHAAGRSAQLRSARASAGCRRACSSGATAAAPIGPARLGAAGAPGILAGQLHGHERLRLWRRHAHRRMSGAGTAALPSAIWSCRRSGCRFRSHAARTASNVALGREAATAYLLAGRDTSRRMKSSYSPHTRRLLRGARRLTVRIMARSRPHLAAAPLSALRADLVRLGLRARLHRAS